MKENFTQNVLRVLSSFCITYIEYKKTPSLFLRLLELEKGGKDASDFYKWQESMKKVLLGPCIVTVISVQLFKQPKKF